MLFPNSRGIKAAEPPPFFDLIAGMMFVPTSWMMFAELLRQAPLFSSMHLHGFFDSGHFCFEFRDNAFQVSDLITSFYIFSHSGTV